MLAVTSQGHSGGADRLNGAHRIAFNTGHLNQPADRVTGEAKVVFHGNFCGIFYLLRSPA